MSFPQPHTDRLAELGASNRAHCFAALRERGQSSLAELASETGLSRPTVRGHLEAMVAGGLVHEQERPSAAQGGRPAATFSLAPEGAHVIAFDVALHEHRYLLSDLSGTIIAARASEVDPEETPASRTDLLLDGLVSLSSEAGLGMGEITWFSGSIGGLVNSSGAISETMAEAPLLLSDLPARLPAKSSLENDLKAACYAEQRIGIARDLTDVVYALAWHQVSAGMVLDGTIRRGAHDIAGELHLLAPNGRGTAPLPPEWESWPQFLAMVQMAASGDADAIESVDEFCHRTAVQLGLLALSVDPQLVILGGPLVDRSPDFVATLQQQLNSLLPEHPVIPFAPSALGTWGAALGALLRGFEALELEVLGAATPGPRLRNNTTSPLPIH